MKDYSYLTQILHNQFLNDGQVINFSIKRLFSKSKNTSLKDCKHIFITGLARSGTTALLQALDSTNNYASLRYKYMPFILLPKLAKIYTNYFNKNADLEKERLHGDNLKISSESPECLDEPFWIHTKYKQDNMLNKNFMSPHIVDFNLAKAYITLLNSYTKIEKKEICLIKNNNNHLRILSLSELLPNANFLVLFRSPIAHAKSLLKLHTRLKKKQTDDGYILDYMNQIGHWEFGLGKKPFIYENNQNYILKGLEDINLEYWINQWVFTYNWMLNQLKYRNNIRMVCYEDLCEDKNVQKDIFNFLKINQEEIKFKFRTGSSNYDKNNDINVDSKFLKNAIDIYNELRNKN